MDSGSDLQAQSSACLGNRQTLQQVSHEEVQSVDSSLQGDVSADIIPEVRLEKAGPSQGMY